MKSSVLAAFLVATLSSAVLAAVPDNFQQLMLDAVNAERAKAGLTALCMNSKLQTAAQLHSNDQAQNNFMSHTGSSGSTMVTRVEAQGYKWNGIAENVAAGQADVASVMASWMSSSGHKANILGSYTHFGTGYAYSASSTYKHYWTQDFGKGSTESCSSSVVQSNTASPVVTPAPTTKTPTPTTSAPTPAPTTKAPTPAPTTVAPTPAPPSAAQNQASNSVQKQLLDAVNAERAKVGLAALCLNSKLQTAAQLHSNDQAKNNFMSHTGSNGSTMSSRITAQSFAWNSIGENVAAGQADVTAVMAAWMSSSGHKANILGNFKFFGMGYAYSASSTYKHYWTQDFALGSSEACDA